jgi:hypothetical protein
MHPVFALSPTTIEEAAECLGWVGDTVGPVSFGGVCFWAVADVSGPAGGEGRLDVRLSGCLLPGRTGRTGRTGHADHTGSALMRQASLLAAYTPRAVLVADGQDLTGVLVDAAILDQGVVVAGVNGVRLLAGAGPRVALDPTTPREQELLDRVYAAWCLAGIVRAPEVERAAVTQLTVPTGSVTSGPGGRLCTARRPTPRS